MCHACPVSISTAAVSSCLDAQAHRGSLCPLLPLQVGHHTTVMWPCQSSSLKKHSIQQTAHHGQHNILTPYSALKEPGPLSSLIYHCFSRWLPFNAGSSLTHQTHLRLKAKASPGPHTWNAQNADTSPFTSELKHHVFKRSMYLAS